MRSALKSLREAVATLPADQRGKVEELTHLLEKESEGSIRQSLLEAMADPEQTLTMKRTLGIADREFEHQPEKSVGVVTSKRKRHRNKS
ncbi:MAG: hypothetical protein M3Y72_22595 [Acidobacteriota bacterium]|nr:hypothetical protein [Acidobacteriota bacterium]